MSDRLSGSAADAVYAHAYSNAQVTTTSATPAAGTGGNLAATLPDGSYWAHGCLTLYGSNAGDVARIQFIVNGTTAQEWRPTIVANQYETKIMFGGAVAPGSMCRFDYARASGSGTIYINHQHIYLRRMA